MRREGSEEDGPGLARGRMMAKGHADAGICNDVFKFMFSDMD